MLMWIQCDIFLDFRYLLNGSYWKPLAPFSQPLKTLIADLVSFKNFRFPILPSSSVRLLKKSSSNRNRFLKKAFRQEAQRKAIPTWSFSSNYFERGALCEGEPTCNMFSRGRTNLCRWGTKLYSRSNRSLIWTLTLSEMRGQTASDSLEMADIQLSTFLLLARNISDFFN